MKKALWIVFSLAILWFCTATEISFSPNHLVGGTWCLLATDIIVDAENSHIAATDIVLESSLAFVDFVPSETIPYFLPPKTTGNVLHLVWFTTTPQQRITGKATLWRLYFKQKDPADLEWSIRLYIKNTWDTTDTNLSIAWWIDVLETVHDATYSFTTTWVCTHGSATLENIEWWIAATKLKIVLAKVDRDQLIKKLTRPEIIISVVWLCAVILLLLLYYPLRKQWKKL